MEFLFRNRWFAMLFAILLLAGIMGIASRSLNTVPPPQSGPSPSEDSHASFARWAAQDTVSGSDAAEPAGQKRYEVRVYEDGRDVTAQVADLPDGSEQTAPLDPPSP